MMNKNSNDRKLFVIYKITRDDGLIYIGKTNKATLKYRMSKHAKSQRFKEHSFDYIILHENYDHDAILIKEAEYVNLYNSYENGLNKTPSGQGQHNNSYKFTTLGMQFTEETKQKLRNNHWSKTGKCEAWNKGIRVKEKYPHIWDAIRKSKKGLPGKSKFTSEFIENIIYHYQSMPFIRNANSTAKNGRTLNYLRAFAKEYCKHYGMNIKTMENILNNKYYIHKETYERCFNAVNY